MNPRYLTFLLVAAGATVVVAVVALRSGEPSAEAPGEREKLFPALAKKVNDVATIRVQRKDGGYTLHRVGDGWALADRSDFPVQMDAVRKTILALVDMSTVEAKTADPAKWEKLGVQDFDAEGSKSTLVTLLDKDGAELAKLVVGKEAESKGNAATSGQIYVRKAGEPQSWLVSGRLALHEKPLEWMQKEILKVPQDRIRSAEIRQPDGETLLVDRPTAENKDFTLHDVPAGKEPTYPTVANTMATGLEYVNLEDVVPAADVDFATGTGPIARFATFDGLVVTVTTKDQDGKSYAAFSASYEAPVVPEGPVPPEGDAPKSAKKTPEEVQKEVADLNARLSKWAYVISSYNRSLFGKKKSEMVKDPAPPAGASAAPGGEEGDQPMVIPGDLPPEIQEQIRAHQESIGNKTVTGPPRPKPADPDATGTEPPKDEPPHDEPKGDKPKPDEPVPQEKPPHEARA